MSYMHTFHTAEVSLECKNEDMYGEIHDIYICIVKTKKNTSLN